MWMMAMLLQGSVAVAPVPGSFDRARATALPSATLTIPPRCPSGAGSDDILVCGDRRDRYRLPLPIDRTSDPLPRDLPGGMAALTSAAPCGIFAGQRRCRKGETLKYGYGGGRDPVTLLTRLATKVVDPDAD